MANEITVRVYEQGQGTPLNSGTFDRGASFDVSVNGLAVGDHTLEATAQDSGPPAKAESSRVSAGTITVDAVGGEELQTLGGTPYVWAPGSGSNVQTPAFSVPAAGLLIALITSEAGGDYQSGPSGATPVVGGGLTWTRVAGFGENWVDSAEIWIATSTGPLTDITVTADFPSGAQTRRGIYVYAVTGQNASPVGLHSSTTAREYQANSLYYSIASGLTPGSFMFMVVNNGAAYDEPLTAGANNTLDYNPPNERGFAALRSTVVLAGSSFIFAATGYAAAEDATFGWVEILAA